MRSVLRSRETSYPLLALLWALFGLSLAADHKRRRARSVRKLTLRGLDGIPGRR